MRTADLLDDLGEPVPLAGPVSRAVSLVPSLTEAVAVSAPGRLAGATKFCVHPSTLDVPRVGGSKYPRIDQVLDLAPDLVLANTEENRLEDVETLRANGIPVWVMEAAPTVPAALGSLRRLLTQAFELEEPDWLVEAEDLWREVRPVRFHAVIPVWRKPWIVLGRDTFGGDILRRVGVENIYASDAERYPRPDLEELRAHFTTDADLLVLPDEPYEFTATDGPDAFPDVRYVLVSGRHLTWYGPSLTEAHPALLHALPHPS
jgi:ABC-type Fe3+-hydroxamate transport system substrate-binding protein